MKEYYKKLLKNIEKGPVMQVSFFTGPFIGEKISKSKSLLFTTNDKLLSLDNLFKNKEHNKIYESENGSYLFEVLNTSPTLVLFGGGHVCLAISKIASFLNMPYVVVEDRKDFCSKERFKDAKALICCDSKNYFEELDKLNLGGNTYNVIATRGHKNDNYCLENVLKRDFGYVGMIGSKTKVKACFDILREKGFEQDLIDKVYSPIGLKIGSESPQEIAISIFAQIIEHKNKTNKFNELNIDIIKELLKKDKSILCQIIKQSGSSPRHIGSLMLVTKDNTYGSVGGGAIELRSVNHSIKMINNNDKENIVNMYRLNNTDASNLGMICGGNADILHTIIN